MHRAEPHAAELHAAIDCIQHLPPEYQQGLSNHLPMALHALHGLGAGPDRLHAFGEVYARRFLGQHAPLAASAVADWQALRGQSDAYAALHASFSAMLQTQGRDATLRVVLPALWPGLSGAAFHGLIRCGHAVQGAHDGELAQALAYWAWRWQPSAPVQATQPALTPEAWAAALQSAGAGWRSAAPRISLRMVQAQQTVAYLQLGAGPQPLPADLRQALQPLAAFAARRYAQTRHFTVLHMVTACRAVLALSPWLEDGPSLRAELLQAYTAAYLSCGLAPASDLPPIDRDAPGCDWPALRARAVQSDDDHIVKLVHACHDLQAAYGDGPWRDAACRAVSAAEA